MIDYAETDKKSEAFFAQAMERSKKAGGVDALMAEAALHARRSVEADGLLPTRDELGELVYDDQQAYKAACHTREDAVILVYLQVAGLRVLNQVKAVSLACLAVLVYIAYRVS